MSYNLVIAGIGGQGSILAARVVADAAIKAGVETGEDLKVRVGETFGAAMRGGSVASHVRIGSDVGGPLVPKSGAQAILALEPLEALRVGVPYLAPGGVVILNTSEVMPMEVKIGAAKYPEIEEIKTALSRLGGKVFLIDATKLAVQAGNAKTVSAVMLGALANLSQLPFNVERMKEALKERVPQKTIEVNKKAFELGFEAAASYNDTLAQPS